MQQQHTAWGKPTTILILAILCSSVSAPALAQTEPIVFVHGYSGATSNFDTMVNRFTASGYPAAKLYRFGYNSFQNSNKTSGEALSNFINTVRFYNGNQRVSVVAHSNGGLVTRWHRVKLNGNADMRRFISLGTPHKGTTGAYSCYAPACYDMRPNSSFLTQLVGMGCDRSLWSASDDVISPVNTAQCGYSVQTANVSHVGLLYDASVYSQIRALLQ